MKNVLTGRNVVISIETEEHFGSNPGNMLFRDQ